MKKFFTLALTLCILNAAFSQAIVARVSFGKPGYSAAYNHRYDEQFSFSKYERDMQFQKLNAYYNQQMNYVMNLRMRAGRKVRLLHELEAEKANQIRNINNRFCDTRNKYNDAYYNNDYSWRR